MKIDYLAYCVAALQRRLTDKPKRKFLCADIKNCRWQGVNPLLADGKPPLCPKCKGMAAEINVIETHSWHVRNRRANRDFKVSHVQIDPLGIVTICTAIQHAGVTGDRKVNEVLKGCKDASLQAPVYCQRGDLEYVLAMALDKYPDLKLPTIEDEAGDDLPAPGTVFFDE